jgi:SPP1 gp7 family putative phage head morphogenesis protein
MNLILVFSGAITVHSLSHDYHTKVSSLLESAVFLGFGGDMHTFSFQSPEFKTIKALRKSIYAFSAAKQYQQVRTMSAFIDKKGEVSAFKEFKEKASRVFGEYNKNYLHTEYKTAIGQSQSARDWVNIEKTKDVLPYITYRTQRDSHVRDEHAVLDGITLPADDPFWNNCMPKNGWNCRCFTVQKERAKVTDLKERDLSALDDQKKFPDVFKMNPGKDGLIFNPKYHPYFFVAKGDADWKKQNFGLPL